MNHTILLTIDVEDWFQVENFKKCIPYSSWPNCELRVERNVHKILDLLDSIKLNNSTNPMNSTNPKATFFILGWIARHLPNLVCEIKVKGHEVASHGYYHKLCKEESAEGLKNDLATSKKLLEDITGAPVYGYRAPGFSISTNILNRIEEAGYFYDSSFNSFKFNKRYGQVEWFGNNGNGIIIKISDSFYELPISNLSIGGQVIPWGGGGYFRLFPLKLFKQGVQSILKKQGVYLFYLHPWEIDPEQPPVKDVPFTYRMRHYMNMKSTYSKLSAFIEKFKDYKFQTCYQYLLNNNLPKEVKSSNY
jgi:polysaccharide deacetylase family protein (PEP-CTERM system associated)